MKQTVKMLSRDVRSRPTCRGVSLCACALLLSIAWAAFGAPPVSAGTLITTLPGSMCVENNTEGVSNYSQLGIANLGSTPKSYLCPLPNTFLWHGGASSYLGRAYWWAKVWDNHPSDHVMCRLWSCGGGLGSCIFSPLRQSTGTGWQTISMTTVFGPRSYTDHLWLQCQVPGAFGGFATSGIEKYTIYEFD